MDVLICRSVPRAVANNLGRWGDNVTDHVPFASSRGSLQESSVSRDQLLRNEGAAEMDDTSEGALMARPLVSLISNWL